MCVYKERITGESLSATVTSTENFTTRPRGWILMALKTRNSVTMEHCARDLKFLRAGFEFRTFFMVDI